MGAGPFRSKGEFMDKTVAKPRDFATHTFQSFWFGPRLSPLEHMCVKSFLAHGHAFILYAYDDVENVPDGCTVEDARAILPREDFFQVQSGDHIGSPSPFSDRFRYELLRAYGGWWVDTDVLCLADRIPDTPYVFAKEDEHTYNGAILRVPADSEFLRRAIDHCRQARDNVALESTLATGPALVNRLICELSLEGYAWAREELYPVRWDEPLLLFDPAEADRIETRVTSAMFLHLWTGMLRTSNILKDVRPPESSYLDRLYVAYDVSFPTSQRYTWSEIKPQYEFQKVQWSLWDEVDQARKDREALAEENRQLRERAASLEHELQRTGEENAVLRNMKVVRWSAPARRLVYRLRARRG
jgi:hypothetical protein